MIQSFATRDEVAAAAADFVSRALQDGIERRGQACAALSGGATPKAAYERLAAVALDWPRSHFLQVDERCVPIGAPGLNADMLRGALSPALAQGARLLPLWNGGQAPEQAAAAADALYRAYEIDAAIMGMGLDGHTASWFPGSPDLSRALEPKTEARVIAVDAPGAEAAQARLTVTLSGLTAARHLALLIQGKEKRVRLTQALERETPQTAPILALLRARPDCSILWAP